MENRRLKLQRHSLKQGRPGDSPLGLGAPGVRGLGLTETGRPTSSMLPSSGLSVRASNSGAQGPLRSIADGGSRVIFEPEVLTEDSDRSFREGSSSDPPSANVARARWLEDRESSGPEDWEGTGKLLEEELLPMTGVQKLRDRLARRRQEAAGGHALDSLELHVGDSLASPKQRPLKRALRKGAQRTSLSPASAAPAMPLQHLPRPVLVGLLCLGCGLAAAVAYHSRNLYPNFPVVSSWSPSGGAVNQVLGHVAVEEAPVDDLAPVLADGSVLLRKAAADAFLTMQADARRRGIYLLPLSGFRSVKDQQDVFYGVKAARNQNIRDRAKVSAPPGFSEHHTGYALDIGDASEPGTHLEFDFENTDAFHWLQLNANRYHFELSFPPDNQQGIMYEPWHWRFVGNNHATVTFYGSMEAETSRAIPKR